MTLKLGDILVRHGFIDGPKLDAALADQQAFGGKLGRTLVDLGYINEEQLVIALAEQLGLSTIDLDNGELDPEAFRFLAVDACERYGVFPVKVDQAQGLLWVATAEPDRKLLQEVAQIAQLTLEPMLAPMSSIDRAVRRYYYGEKGGPKQRLGEPMKTIPLDAGSTVRPKVAAAAGKGAPAAAKAALPAALATPPAPAPAADGLDVELSGIVPSPRSTDGVAELRELIIRLEKTVAAQGRAFRALVELLQDKGVVRRGELGTRTGKK